MNKTDPPQQSYKDIDFGKPVPLSKPRINWRKLPLKKAFFIAWIISPIPGGIPAASYFLGRESLLSLRTSFAKFRRKKTSSEYPDMADNKGLEQNNDVPMKTEESKLG